MSITVAFVTDRTKLQFPIEDGMTVAHLRNTIQNIRQRRVHWLVFQGQPMLDDEMLADFDFSDTNVVHCVEILAG